jgi:hypothetical protein
MLKIKYIDEKKELDLPLLANQVNYLNFKNIDDFKTLQSKDLMISKITKI